MPQGSRRYNYAAQFGTDVDVLLHDVRCMLLDGRNILTAEVSAFENAFAAYTQTSFARGVNSGTDAIIIALLALGVGPGDEVVTQANTFHATVAAIQLVGATPVLVDAEDDSYLMNVGQVPAVLTSSTRVLLPVHLFGKPTEPTELLRIARQHQLHIVEDAASARRRHR